MKTLPKVPQDGIISVFFFFNICQSFEEVISQLPSSHHLRFLASRSWSYPVV